MSRLDQPDPAPTADQPASGLALVGAAMLIAPGMDALAKLLTQDHSPGAVALFRFAAQTALLIPLLSFVGWERPRPAHLLAGTFLALALLMINAAFREMPIANALAIFFVEPLLLTVLSALILGERIGWRRIAAVVVGLLGALIVIRPNHAVYGSAALYPLATAFLFAGYLLTLKVLTRRGRLLGLQFWTGLSALGVLLGLGLSGVMPDFTALSAPRREDLALILALGAISVLAHQLVAHGLARMQASLVAPMQYLEIVSATLLGWWIFGDFPDMLTWAGTAIIIAAGLYVFHRERRVPS